MAEAFELIIVTFQEADKAGQVFKAQQKALRKKKNAVVSAATLVKDTSGQTQVQDTLGLAKKRGGRRGAVAGAVLTLLAPPVGAAAVLAGAGIGAVAGRKLSQHGDVASFTRQFVREVLGEMGPGSSALVILTAAEKTAPILELLADYGGETLRASLSAEQADRLVSAARKDEASQDEPQPPAAADSSDTATRIREALRTTTRRPEPAFERVEVIINPASGKDQPILNTLNTVFRAADLQWDVRITQGPGDARRFASEAAAAGADVVAIYGGDGAVMEAASGLIGSDVPLAILPGGTNNVVSVELGIPRPLVDAAALIAAMPAEIRKVDMGRANDHHFLLRVGIGYEAVINETADRELKDRLGGFAYSLAGLKALRNPPIARYRLTLDGQVEELEGLWVMVANSASMGAPNLQLVQDISVSDGLLDVIVVRQADLDSLLSVVGSMAKSDWVGKPLPHWQVKEVTVECDPPMAVTGDGELWEPTPLHASVLPQAVNILVPAP